MQAKRHMSEGYQPQMLNTRGVGLRRRPDIDPQLEADLASQGMRARKAVSDGHRTATRIPSYLGETIGPTDPTAIARQFEAQASAERSVSDAEKRVRAAQRPKKRRLDDLDEDDDDGTDVDEDDLPNRPTSFTEAQAYYVPKAYRGHSQTTDDFENADFLQPKDSLDGQL